MLSVPIIVYRISRRVLPVLVLTGVRHHSLAPRRCIVKVVLLLPAGRLDGAAPQQPFDPLTHQLKLHVLAVLHSTISCPTIADS